MLRKSSGITLIALVVTIVILLILAGTATFTGMSAIENSIISTFRTEMEMMKLQLNSPSELEEYKNAGSILEESQKNYLGTVQNSLNEDNIDITLERDGFKYFTKEEIKTISNIEITRNLYINPETKTIVSSEGVNCDGKICYMLEQLPNSLYNVETNIQNSGDITFNITADKLKITISNIEYIAPYVNKGTIQYKLSTDENWTILAQDSTSKNFTFEVPKSGEYYIKITDAKGNEKNNNITLEKTVLEYATQAKPTGAYIDTRTNEDTGIVMIDSQGNEWVWIEVPKEAFTTAKSGTEYDKIKADLIEYATDYRKGATGQGCNWTDEWYDGCGIASADEYNTKYQTMLSSVYENKGFYISRYEAGIEGSDTNINLARTERTAITSTSPKAVSKKDMIPYNWVYCSDAQQLANEMATGNKTSSLLFGIQWDLVCKFLEVKVNWDIPEGKEESYYIKTNSTSWGNYEDAQITNLSGKYAIYSQSSYELGAWNTISSEYEKPNSGTENMVLLSTGASECANKMNIYDFVGNEWEWTLEHATTYTSVPCSRRGGGYSYTGSNYPASYRRNNDITISDSAIGLRVSLY